jgi:hypothetical protein
MGKTWLSLLVVGALAGTTSAAPEMDGLYIVNDLEAARAAARQTGRPIFVVFRCER